MASLSKSKEKVKKMVKLYNENNEIIADVEYNQNLDRWDGRNYTNGGLGMHKGFGYLEEENQFYIIVGSQWQGAQNYAYCVSTETLIREIIDSGNIDQIDKFPELQTIYNAKFNKKTEKSRVFSVRVKHDETTENIETKIAEMRAKINKYTLDFNTNDTD
jgi:hypothetical protein